MSKPALMLVVLLAACGAKQTPEKTTPGPSAAPAPVQGGEPGSAGPAPSDVERIFTIAPSDKTPKLGSATAKVKLEVCSDFECPFCARLAPTMHELVENYGELVRVEWRHCPLPFHEHALPAAEAAAEVYAQGGDKAFWAYHDQLFAHQDALSADALVTYAHDVPGIDADKVRAALADHRHVPQIQGDLKAVVESGAASGGFGTPATFVNGRLVSGAQPYGAFEEAVERALKETPVEREAAEAQSRAAYPMVRLRHVLIQYQGAKGADAEVTRTKDEARALASELHQRIVTQAARLADLAKQYSDCPSAPEGGELGRFTRGELVPDLEKVAFALTKGELSPVVETPFGFHVILREE